MSTDAWLDLGNQVLDKGLLDVQGRQAGKVDDLLLEWHDGDVEDGGQLEVVGLLTGPMAMSEASARPVRWAVRLLYRLLGLQHPVPEIIPWNQITAIEVVVHLGTGREKTGWTRLERRTDG